MASEFNAYHKWLGIPPEESAGGGPHHYRLLGIQPFETDPDVIESAADQRMAHLRSLQGGKHGGLSQKLLNEVAAARVCLLDPAKRAAYDAQLRQRLAPAKVEPVKVAAKPLAKAAPPVEPPAAMPVAVFPAMTRPAGAASAASPGQAVPVWLIATMGAGGGCVLLLAAVIVISSWNSGGSTASNPQRPPKPQSKAVAPAPPPIARPPPSVPAADPIPPAPPTGTPTTATPEVPPAPEAPPPASPPVGVDPPAPPRPLAPLAPAVGITTELLPLVDTRQVRVQAEWRFDGQWLGSRFGTNNVLEIPQEPPAEYDLHLTLRRDTKLAGGGVVLPVEPAAVLLGIQVLRPGGQWGTGLSLVDGQWRQGEPPLSADQVLPPGQTVALTMRVRAGRVRVEREGNVILDWAGDFSGCTLPAVAKTSSPRKLAVYAGSSKIWFSRLAITPLGAAAGSAATNLPAAAGRKPVPTDAEQTPARRSLSEVTRDAPKRTAADKLKLAEECCLLAKQSQNRPAERFVLLREAQEWAAEAANPRLAIETTDLLVAEYDLDSAEETLRVVGLLAGAAKEDAAIAAVLTEALPLAERASAAQQHDVAQRMLEGLVRLVQRPAGRKFAAQIAELRRANIDAGKEARQLEAAREKLKSAADDPEANLVVGSWLCFTAGDWNAGLPHLAKGSDEGLAACAKRELAGPLSTSAHRAALAEFWWEAGEKAAGQHRRAIAARAVHWLQRALPDATGLAKVKIDRRLAEIGASASAGKPKGRVLIVVHDGNEIPVARKACQRFGLDFEEAKSFDRNRRDYSPFSTIVCGSNNMDYWGAEAEAKKPEAFEHVERFVRDGGHLVLFGSFNGRNCEHLGRFGIYTGAIHASTYRSAGPATELFVQGVEDLLPQDGKMRSAGSFYCTRQHEVLLRIGPGPREGEAGLVSIPYAKGRVTFTNCEPHWMNDFWLITVMMSWVSRGSPVP